MNEFPPARGFGSMKREFWSGSVGCRTSWGSTVTKESASFPEQEASSNSATPEPTVWMMLLPDQYRVFRDVAALGSE
eukprot:1676312-Alexandrium_andersonii.AAC.1